MDPNIAFSDTESMLSKRTGASDWAGARWTGRLVAPATGEYTFYFYSDNGARLYVGDMETPIIDWWVNQWDVEQKSAPIHLEEGQVYDFKMDWFEATGGSHVYVRWSNDQGMEKTEIPASAFYLPADFAGPIVDDVNTDNAQLDKDQGLGGTITLTGANRRRRRRGTGDAGRFFPGTAGRHGDGFGERYRAGARRPGDRKPRRIPHPAEAGYVHPKRG